MSRSCGTTDGRAATLFAGVIVGGTAALLFVVKVVLPVLAGVCSLRGLRYSFGLGSADGLAFPAAVRAVTLLLGLELMVVVGMALDFRDGRRHLEWRWAWAVAHGTVLRRMYRRGRWLARIAGRRLLDAVGDYALPLAARLWTWAAALGSAAWRRLRQTHPAGPNQPPAGLVPLPEPLVPAVMAEPPEPFPRQPVRI